MKRHEPAGSPRRILLVDDNGNGTPARQAALEELGYQTGAAASGTEAIVLFEQQPFDLVVTDYRMPGMNGAELIAELRSRRPELPIVLLSGFAQAGGLTEAATGANVVLQKGATECNLLVRAVNRLLSQRASRKRPAASPSASQSAIRRKANG